MSETDERVEIIHRAMPEGTARMHAERAVAALDAYDRERQSSQVQTVTAPKWAGRGTFVDAATGDEVGNRTDVAPGNVVEIEPDEPSDRDLLRALAAHCMFDATGTDGLVEAGLLKRMGFRDTTLALTDKAREAIRAAINREEG